ncbi:probable RNA-binding protein EIF1AD [Phlebotomus argentipes]|uniref:probable RNA-binding protein EIF1AD n=1 Tax=Phlebotomus argentipes TaxID=94469 RepID=UPI0028933809|nr:probable RNA-binding protein EIF1AD [Phlebotomus argentipes]
MSRTTKRKHVMREFLMDNFDLPSENQTIVRVVQSRGNYLFDVESPGDEENFLVSMPTKFRKNMWVKRGDFLLVEPIEEGNKVKAEIVKILTPEHIKEFTKANVWPKKFTSKRPLESEEPEADFSLSENPNRRRPDLCEAESSSETDSD